QLQLGMLRPVPDRRCPPDSTCASGYCQIPSPQHACASNHDCSGGVCNVFVKADGRIGKFCSAGFPGGATATSPCNNDNQCDTGVCDEAERRTSCMIVYIGG